MRPKNRLLCACTLVIVGGQCAGCVHQNLIPAFCSSVTYPGSKMRVVITACRYREYRVSEATNLLLYAIPMKCGSLSF
ncbi:hypothetical protein BD413DRAFT_80681 [Trametes elegans]|nr:hypothetical protein BD413DRAFT_80681 [Trametes elegans]